MAATTRVLIFEDIGPIDPKREASRKYDEFSERLRKYTSKAHPRSPLLRAIFHTYRAQFIIAFICQLAGNYMQLLVSPIVYLFGLHLHEAFKYSGNDKQERFPVWISLLYVLALALAALVSRLFRAHAVYQSALVGREVRTLLGASIYKKSMRVSRTAIRPLAFKVHQQMEKERLQQKLDPGNESSPSPQDSSSTDADTDLTWNDGAILNTMLVDTDFIAAAIAVSNNIIPYLLVLPPFLGLCWFYMSWPGLLGATLIAISPLPLTMFSSKISNRRTHVNEISRERTNLVLSIIRGIRFLKSFAWEDCYLSRVDKKRKEESKSLFDITFYTGLLFIFEQSSSRYPSLLINVLYATFYPGGMSLAYKVMGVHTAISALVANFDLMIADSPKLFNGFASLQNVQDFLLEMEQDPGKTFGLPQSPNNAIELNQACFEWEKPNLSGESHSERAAEQTTAETPQTFILHPITLSIGSSELMAVVGPVGAGKSSLAAGLLGEMKHTGGKVGISLETGNVSYYPQTPWIQKATIKENIIFGQPVDETRYTRILHACGLDVDIQYGLFPQGNRTVLGERGKDISGGQKARIQLARTLYQNSPTVILDDPLSALDAHTMNHLFKYAIKGELNGTSRLLITHQVHILNQCDRVVWMEGGGIRKIDTYTNLMASEPDFVSFIGQEAKRIEEAGNSAITTLSDESMATLEGHNDSGEDEEQSAMEEKEKLEIEAIPLSLYGVLLHTSASWPYIVLLFTLLAVTQTLNMAITIIVAVWSAHVYRLSDLMYALVMLSCIVGQNITWVLFFLGIQRVCINTSRTIMHETLDRLLHAPLDHFKDTSIGRIMNRLSSDVEITDSALPLTFWSFCRLSTSIVALLASVAVYVPFSLVLFVPWFLMMVLILFLYSSTPLAVRRLESNSRSSFVAKLEEGLAGRVALTSCGRVADFQRQLFTAIDELNSVGFVDLGASGWISIRAGLLSFLLTLCIGILVVEKRFSLPPSLVLLVLSLCPEFSGNMTFGLVVTEDLQRCMNSLERIVDYRDQTLDEGPRYRPIGESWPVDGSIQIHDASMSYRPNATPCLSNVNLSFASGEKIAIVGRTGAGKSSLISMLQRTAYINSGSVIISGLDTSTIGLHTLRKAITVIPQDPTLFLGEIWSNLNPEADPNDADSNDRMIAALRDVGLIEADGTSKVIPGLTLNTVVSADGNGYSPGARQLIGLARALISNSPIIVIDEATSSVDHMADARIQDVLRRRFTGRTLLAIVHRIPTALDYDQICVIDKGRVVEFDTPRVLWEQNGHFRKLCDESKITQTDFKSRILPGM